MDVKVCDNLHARIILGYNKQKHDTFVIIGSFDFTKEAISGELYNIGICSKDPELFKNTFKFFTNLWESEETKELDEYWESK